MKKYCNSPDFYSLLDINDTNKLSRMKDMYLTRVQKWLNPIYLTRECYRKTFSPLNESTLRDVFHFPIYIYLVLLIVNRSRVQSTWIYRWSFHTWWDGKREEGSCGNDEEYPEGISRAVPSSTRPPLNRATAAGIVIAVHPRRGVGRSPGLHIENDIGLFLLVLFLLPLLPFPVGFFLAVGVLGQVGGRRCASSTRRSCPARVAGTAVTAAAAGTVDRRLASIHGLRMQRRRRWPATCHRGRLRSSTYPTRGGRDYTHAGTTCGGPVPHPACNTVRPGDTIAAARHYRDLGRPSRATSLTRHT